MLANRNALVLRLATGDRQIIAGLAQLPQLFRDSRINGVVQTSRHFLTRIVRIVEHRLIRIVFTVNDDRLVQLVVRNAVTLHGFADGRSDETMKLVIVRNRISHLFERLDDATDNTRIGFGQRAVKIKQYDLLRMFGHF